MSSGSSLRRIAAGLLPAFALAYPFVVFLGLRRGDARSLALVLLAVLGLGFVLRRIAGARASAWSLVGPGLAVAMIGVGLVLGHEGPIKSVPVLVSAGLLIAFAGSLVGGETLVERFARRIEGTLSPAQVAHCRQVTWAWCVFFVFNIATTLGLAFWAPLSWWSLYTGALAYVLMGSLFVLELAVRTARFGRRTSIDRSPGGASHGAFDR